MGAVCATRIIERRVNDRKQQQLVVFLFPKQLSSTATTMDIYNLYMGEGYGSLRNPVTFRDYEKHPYGSWEKTASNKGSYYQQQQNKSYSGGQSVLVLVLPLSEKTFSSSLIFDRINILVFKLISHFW